MVKRHKVKVYTKLQDDRWKRSDDPTAFGRVNRLKNQTGLIDHSSDEEDVANASDEENQAQMPGSRTPYTRERPAEMKKADPNSKLGKLYLAQNAKKAAC